MRTRGDDVAGVLGLGEEGEQVADASGRDGDCAHDQRRVLGAERVGDVDGRW
ncbi:hypothetical protein [Janibacter limosus]|uniref:hypothetical protein n=1 Tax=Janibacter limosus TaxID=53458 RepID=UPI0035E26F45